MRRSAGPYVHTLERSCKTGTVCTVRAYPSLYGDNKFVAFVSANDSA